MEIDFKILIDRIVMEDDQEAFSEIFDHFYPKLFQFSIRFVRYPEYAEEVISEVFYKLLKKKNKLKDIQNINYYLLKSVKNQSLTFLRNEKKNNVLDHLHYEDDYLIPDTQNPETNLVNNELQSLLEEAINKLPERRKLIFKMVREEGLSYVEVGELLEISPRTVETHLGLAIKDLCMDLRNIFDEQKNHPKIRKIISRGLFSLFF